jgi:diguanylate cyclase (GGDEF)-like protein
MTNPIVIEIRVLEEALFSLKYDSLTGLYTRRTFDDMFSRETDRATRYGLELSVLFFDLDDFKKINDTFGHQAGDETLKHVARLIMGELRTIDIAVRYGGEEIVVVLPETGKIDAFVVGERIRERVENARLDYKGQNISLTISGGIASFPIDAIDTENLIKNSDIAVYKAKEAGKNNIVIFSEHKRRYIRVDFIADIQVQVVDPNSKMGTLDTTSKNLSAGGILFESKYPIDIDTKVQLRIPTDPSAEPLVIVGDVVRIEKSNASKYDIGISFLGVDYASRSVLSRCIRKCIEKKE